MADGKTSFIKTSITFQDVEDTEVLIIILRLTTKQKSYI